MLPSPLPLHLAQIQADTDAIMLREQTEKSFANEFLKYVFCLRVGLRVEKCYETRHTIVKENKDLLSRQATLPRECSGNHIEVVKIVTGL